MVTEQATSEGACAGLKSHQHKSWGLAKVAFSVQAARLKVPGHARTIVLGQQLSEVTAGLVKIKKEGGISWQQECPDERGRHCHEEFIYASRLKSAEQQL